MQRSSTAIKTSYRHSVQVALQRMGALGHMTALLLSPTPLVREVAVIGIGDMCVGLVHIQVIVLRESGAQLCALLEVDFVPC